MNPFNSEDHALGPEGADPPLARPIQHGQDGRATDGGLVRIRQGAYLPHWTRGGGFYAVVFRLHDSLPVHVVAEWKAQRNRLLRAGSATSADEQRMRELFAERVERHLDAGQGVCWMRRPAIAKVVADALVHFDGTRYRLLAWCVMPNHVHVVVRPNPDHELMRIVHSWKSFSASRANTLLGRRGAFWQPEYYDHLIRDEVELFHAIEYALNNPLAASLCDWPWTGIAPDLASLLDAPWPASAADTSILPP